MAKLIMSDGTVRNCDYNKAAKIQQILIGMAEPEDEKQADFVSQVAKVDFNDGMEVAHAEAPAAAPREPDLELEKIMKNPKLKGVEKARAVAKRIKERTQ